MKYRNKKKKKMNFRGHLHAISFKIFQRLSFLSRILSSAYISDQIMVLIIKKNNGYYNCYYCMCRVLQNQLQFMLMISKSKCA